MSLYQLPLTTAPTSILPTAIRPLLNLSQTCFLSAILQAFFHNPLLKQYFLNEGHARRTCEAQRGNKTGKEDQVVGLAGGIGECMGCEMDSAFIEVSLADYLVCWMWG
jgi:ubiquitin carboxyl-terminal hydrolase 22/27/51